MSASTTSTPSFASAFALSELALRVMARGTKPPAGSSRIARTSPPPCAPVAPTTAMIFLSAMGAPRGWKAGILIRPALHHLEGPPRRIDLHRGPVGHQRGHILVESREHRDVAERGTLHQDRIHAVEGDGERDLLA